MDVPTNQVDFGLSSHSRAEGLRKRVASDYSVSHSHPPGDVG